MEKLIGLAPSGDPLTNKLLNMLNDLGYKAKVFLTQTDMETYARSTAYSTS